MNKFVLLVLALSVFFLIIGTSSLFAQSLVPYNGTFNTGVQGWSLNALDCGWDDVNGYPSAGSMYVSSSCVATSQSFTTDAAWTLSARCATSDISGTLKVRWRTSGSTGSWNDWCSGSNAWDYWEAQSFSYSGTFVVEFTGSGPGSMYVDSVEVTGGNATSVTPTPGPTATAAATSVSGTSAAARVTASAATPYYTYSSTPVPMPINVTGSGDLSDMIDVSMETRDIGLCLPSEISQVFADVNACLSVPMISFTSFKLFGVNLIGSLTLLGGVLFFVFIIRQLQEK